MKSARIDRRDLLFLALLAVLPMLGYQFGLGNQVEQFSIVRRLLDPEFIPADFYVNSASQFGPRYYYAQFLAFLVRFAPFPLVILTLTYFTNLALAVISFDAARRLVLASRAGAAVAALIVIVNSSFSLGLAGFIRFESFQPANMAIPFALFGVTSLVSGRLFVAATAFSIAAIFHPLIGVETAMIAYAACAVAQLMSGRSVLSLARFIPSGLIFSAVIIVFWAAPALQSSTEHLTDAEFFSILPVFRAPHHYLAASFPAAHYFSAALFAAGLVYLALRQRWHEGETVEGDALLWIAAIAIALCAASFVFVDLLHSRTWTAAQVFRNLFLLKWVGFIFFGAAAGRWLKRPEIVFLVAAIAPVLATGEAQPLVFAASIGALVVFGLTDDARAGGNFLAALLAVFAAATAWKIGVREEMARAVFGAGCFWLIYKTPVAAAAMRAVAVAGAAGALAFGYWNKDVVALDIDVFKPTYSWADIKDDDAVVARWVRDNTPANSVWVTPPDFERFRLLAERAIVADYTSIPFEEMAMREWRTRMATLYGDVEGGGFKALRGMDRNYRNLTADELQRRALAFGASYAVIYEDTPWQGPVLFQAGAYKVVAVAPGKAG